MSGRQETDAALLRRLRGIIESASLDRLYYESSPDEMRRLCDLAERAEQAERYCDLAILDYNNEKEAREQAEARLGEANATIQRVLEAGIAAGDAVVDTFGDDLERAEAQRDAALAALRRLLALFEADATCGLLDHPEIVADCRAALASPTAAAALARREREQAVIEAAKQWYAARPIARHEALLSLMGAVAALAAEGEP